MVHVIIIVIVMVIVNGDEIVVRCRCRRYFLPAPAPRGYGGTRGFVDAWEAALRPPLVAPIRRDEKETRVPE